jgi:hypothetical protein
MLAWCACPTASTYSTAAIAIANVRIISFPSLNCLRSLPKHSDARSAIETNDSFPSPSVHQKIWQLERLGHISSVVLRELR